MLSIDFLGDIDAGPLTAGACRPAGGDRGGPVHWVLHQRHRSFRYARGLRSVTSEPDEPADCDPTLVAEAERDIALAFD